MNLAFPALCIVLLVLPGILFRRAYSRGALFFRATKGRNQAINKYPTSTLPLTEEIGVSLVWAIILHVIWLNLFTWIGSWSWIHNGFAPNYEQLLFLIYGDLTVSPEQYECTLRFVASQHTILAYYFLSLYLFSAIAGRVCLWFVRILKLDLNWMFARLEDQ